VTLPQLASDPLYPGAFVYPVFEAPAKPAGLAVLVELVADADGDGDADADGDGDGDADADADGDGDAVVVGLLAGSGDGCTGTGALCGLTAPGPVARTRYVYRVWALTWESVNDVLLVVAI
jgi:hypothetical protein